MSFAPTSERPAVQRAVTEPFAASTPSASASSVLPVDAGGREQCDAAALEPGAVEARRGGRGQVVGGRADVGLLLRGGRLRGRWGSATRG